jgi:hypothetical protein
MNREINLDSIRALEQQIQEHETAIIKLKRVRNSLLNVSTLLPPEILGNIFRWNVVPDGDFGGLPKASHNFLLVCHHWFQVASGAPELWGFWGNSIQDWGRQHARCRTASLDLVLSGCAGGHLDDTLRDALQDRAARDLIRRVHLESDSAELLNSVISSIITEGEETQSNSAESFILRNRSRSSIDSSSFFFRYHLPKLQCLDLYECNISSWDLLSARTTSLTTLSLTTSGPSPLPTLSQLLSILSTNPNLQSLALSGSVPDVCSDGTSQIPLRHLKDLSLDDDFRRIFGLLNRLELPDNMDNLYLAPSGWSRSDLLQTLGPYIGNRVRRRSQDRLRLWADYHPTFFSIKMGHAGEDYASWFMWVDGIVGVVSSEEEAHKLCFDIIAHIPQEKVVEVVTSTLPILRSEELCVKMCNLARLNLSRVDLSMSFVEPELCEPHVFRELLPGLRSIWISDPILSGGDWSPLTNFLNRRAAVGHRISSFSLSGYPHMGEDVAESIRGAVEVFEDGGSCDESDDGNYDGSDDGSNNGY